MAQTAYAEQQQDAIRERALREAAAVVEELETRGAERHLHPFIKILWAIVEPAQPFVDGWHLGAVAEHLEAVTAKQIRKLCINIPPGTMKSLEANVFWPAWMWARQPHLRFMTVSHDQGLATRDCDRMRTLVESPEYMARWPHVRLDPRQNAKTRYQTVQGGWRYGVSLMGRIIGEHPHHKIVDDPHDPKKMVLSDSERQQAIDRFDKGLGPRGAILDATTVLIMQRLDQRDLSGHVLAEQEGWVHLCLPMRYEPKRQIAVTPIGFRDPRRTEGELLWPQVWPEQKVASLVRNELGSWGEAGQLQQRPAPASGLLFKRDWFRTLPVMPAQDEIAAVVRYWDAAATEGGDGARTSGCKMARLHDGRYVILDITKGRFSSAGVDTVMLATARTDGRAVTIQEEQEPGSAGKAVVNARRLLLAGFEYDGKPSTGDKVVRAKPLRAQAEGQNVYLLTGDPERPAAWVKEFLDEIEVFPAGPLKDQVDSASGAFNMLTAENAEPSLEDGAAYPLYH